MQIKQRAYAAITFLVISSLLQIYLYTNIYQGVIHQHHFFYICLIASCWLALSEERVKAAMSKFFLLPLAIVAVSLIFNPYSSYKIKDRDYLNNLKESALSLNRLYQNKPTEIILFEQFDANIIRPYLNDNIKLLNQQMIDFGTLKSFQDFLIWFHTPINPNDIANHIKKHPQTPIFRACGEQKYYNINLIFTLKYNLNKNYCLYELTVN